MQLEMKKKKLLKLNLQLNRETEDLGSIPCSAILKSYEHGTN